MPTEPQYPWFDSEEIEEETGIPIADESDFDPNDLRMAFETLEEASFYAEGFPITDAEGIPMTTLIYKRRFDGLYQVVFLQD